LIRKAVLLVATAALAAPAAGEAQAPPLAITVDRGAPTLWVGDVLGDPAMEELLRSGLPLRMRFRTELWRDRFFDELVEHITWNVVLIFEPLEARFLVGRADADAPDSYASYAAARAAVEISYFPLITPARAGRFYYLATLEIESLSLSDLEELGHWLRGELAPAVGGRRSVAGALGTGLRRLLIRVLDLPARRYNARSERFEIG
jgi:hypothetical protein